MRFVLTILLDWNRKGILQYDTASIRNNFKKSKVCTLFKILGTSAEYPSTFVRECQVFILRCVSRVETLDEKNEGKSIEFYHFPRLIKASYTRYLYRQLLSENSQPYFFIENFWTFPIFPISVMLNMQFWNDHNLWRTRFRQITELCLTSILVPNSREL